MAARLLASTIMYILWILFICTTCILAVDKGNFKTCDQSGFCKRNRAMTPGESPYVVLPETLSTRPTSLSVQLLNTKNQVKLLLELIGLEGDMVRLRVTEAEPIRNRYEPPVGDVLVKEPEQRVISVEKKDDSILVVYTRHHIVITYKPFRLDVIEGQTPLITINSRGLFRFEHYRTKDTELKAEVDKEGGMAKRVGRALYSWFSRPFSPQDPPQTQDGVEQMDQGGAEAEEKKKKDEEEEEKDLWEEHFKTHTDAKPHGPSSVGIDIGFPGFQHVYGIPEHADTLALKSTKNTDPYRLYNLDVFEYDLHNPMALYGSVPFMIAHSASKTLGVFWLNPSEMWIDISNTKADRNVFSKLVDFVKGDNELPEVDTHWMAETGIVDLFLLLGPRPDDIFKQYAALTGSTPLPPLFALAYHQSRWNYNDEQDVYSVDANFDEHDIPMDCLWLDIEHTDGKRYFSWDKTKFPHPGDMIRNISTKGRKMVTIIDPHIKRDDNWDLHREAQSKGFYIKNKDGGDFDGWCWPGSSSYLDFLNPEIRKWWAGRFAPSLYEGSSIHLYTWNDMNEPSVFNGPEVTMHKTCLHGEWEHRDVHNIYGLYNVMASMQGQLERSKNQERPFVLSRAFFAGSQRYGAVWTGDNSAEWEHLKISLPMILSLNIAGITFSGADVGGFFSNPDPELLTRWYQAGAYQPFFRTHAHLDTRRREPWLLPESNKLLVREAIRARYALLPYWYTLFYEAEKHGGPVMRPLWVEFPTDTTTFGMEDQYLVGSSLLVRPVTEAGATKVTVYMPGDNEVWYDVETGQSYASQTMSSFTVTLRSIPVFQRGGSIIPRKERIRRASSLGRHDPYTLYIALDKRGEALGSVYLDDYHTFRYRTKQEFIHRQIKFADNLITSSVLTKGGKFATKSWLEKIVMYGVEQKPNRVELTSPGVNALPLAFGHLAEKKTLVIRKPGVNMGSDWSIVLK